MGQGNVFGDIEELQKFRCLMMQYECAMLEVKTKLDVLNTELSVQNSRNPIESIKCRIKEPDSIMKKMKRQEIPFSVDNIEKNLNDIAGVRVICSFPDDIYTLADYLEKQDDIKLIKKKDYISHPKPNGYRSLHLILEVPIFLTNEKKMSGTEQAIPWFPLPELMTTGISHPPILASEAAAVRLRILVSISLE